MEIFGCQSGNQRSGRKNWGGFEKGMNREERRENTTCWDHRESRALLSKTVLELIGVKVGSENRNEKFEGSGISIYSRTADLCSERFKSLVDAIAKRRTEKPNNDRAVFQIWGYCRQDSHATRFSGYKFGKSPSHTRFQGSETPSADCMCSEVLECLRSATVNE